MADGGFERGQHRRRLALQRDADEDGHALAEQPVVDQGAVAADGARLFERLNAPRGRRGRETDCLAYLVVGGAAVALQVAQNGRVQLVEAMLPARLACVVPTGLRLIHALKCHFYHVSFPYGTFITNFAHIGSSLRRSFSAVASGRQARAPGFAPPNGSLAPGFLHARQLPGDGTNQEEAAMIIGVPKEIKDHEARVGVTPAGVKALTEAGHTVLVETQAGAQSGFPDDEYQNAGAEIVGEAGYVWGKSEMVVKVKEPIEKEYLYFREGLVLFTYLHLAPLPRADRQAAGIEGDRHRL